MGGRRWRGFVPVEQLKRDWMEECQGPDRTRVAVFFKRPDFFIGHAEGIHEGMLLTGGFCCTLKEVNCLASASLLYGMLGRLTM